MAARVKLDVGWCLGGKVSCISDMHTWSRKISLLLHHGGGRRSDAGIMQAIRKHSWSPRWDAKDGGQRSFRQAAKRGSDERIESGRESAAEDERHSNMTISL